MENRLNLNKRTILRLPNLKMFRVQSSTHNMEEEYKKWNPDIRICTYGAGSIGYILELENEFKSQEVWIISESKDKELINKIKAFNWREYALKKSIKTPSLSQQAIKQAIIKLIYKGEIQMNTDKFIDICVETIVDYTNKRLDKTDNKQIDKNDVYVVWNCKTLQNNKALLSTTLFDGMYYECTYNGDKQEMYVDAYKKWENFVVKI